MRALVSIVAALLLIAIVCERTADAEGPLIINVVLPMTGPAAFFGKTEAEALAVYERWIDRSGGVRKRAIHFVVADSQSSPQVAVQLVNGLLGSRPSIIMGFATSAEAGAVAPLVPNGPVIYSFSPVVQPAPGSYVFASSVSAGYLIPVAIRYARDRGYHRIALIDSTDATGQESDRIVLQAMALPENQSLSLVAHERFNPSDVSVAAQIARMQAAAPDLVITFANGSAFATVMRGLLNGGLNVPVEASAANMNYDSRNSMTSCPRTCSSTGSVIRNQATCKALSVRRLMTSMLPFVRPAFVRHRCTFSPGIPPMSWFTRFASWDLTPRPPSCTIFSRRSMGSSDSMGSTTSAVATSMG